MLELRDLTFSYSAPGGSAPEAVLHHVDLTLEEGELVLVAGRTGVGKSTLLGVFNGLVPAFTGGRLTGDVLLDGASILHLAPRDRAHVVGYVGQDPTAGFVTDTVEEELAYGMEQLGLDGGTMRRRVEETLDLLGIAELRNRDLRTLSGGQQQRVAIGSVLTMHPRLLVLDEPTSALDPTAAEDVLATLTRLVHDLGVTVVLAEHRLERVVPFADRIVLVEGDGRVSVGDPAEMLERSPVAPAHRRARPLGGLVAAAAERARRPTTGGAARPGAATRAGADRAGTAPGPARGERGHGDLRAATGGPGRRPGPRRGPGHGADGPQRVGQVHADVGPAGLTQARRWHGPGLRS